MCRDKADMADAGEKRTLQRDGETPEVIEISFELHISINHILKLNKR